METVTHGPLEPKWSTPNTRLTGIEGQAIETSINDIIKTCDSLDTNLISDRYHTFGELYEHRIVLYIALCRYYCNDGGAVWKSKKQSDESTWDGWFLLVIGTESGEQITYHLPMSKWGNCDFAIEYASAPKFDGHISADVLERIGKL